MNEIDLGKRLSVYSASAGTGKTFTLAAYYIGLLLSGESYKNILAVTFTNKATEEMKVRIMSYLYDIANENDLTTNDFFQKAKTYMIRNIDWSDERLRIKARDCFTEMLADYDNVHVSTIDSFLQALLSGMAQLLNQRIGFAPELDQNELFTTAVDRLISEKMMDVTTSNSGTTATSTTSVPNTSAIISDYITARIDDEKNWDIRNSLIQTAGILYSEKAQTYAAEGRIEMDPTAIEAYRKKMAAWKDLPEFKELKHLLSQVEEQVETITAKQIHNSISSAIKNVKQSFENPNSSDKIFCGLSEAAYKQLNETKVDAWQKATGTLYPILLQFQDHCNTCRGLYLEAQLTIKYLNDMRLMQALVDVINETLHEQNKVLLAETSSILRNALKPGDADFILEKAGIRYHHIMIDEFQDTSKLQWEVFLPLLEEILSVSRQTVLIVGDIKQSIYRWRNGDWHIMADLSTNEKICNHYNGKSLKRNFRSQREVVQFNLEAMQSAAHNAAVNGIDANIYNEKYEASKLEDYHTNSHDKGYVRMRVYPVPNNKNNIIQPLIIADMFATIEDLLCKGIKPSDIMILIRQNKEAMAIVHYFQKNIITEEDKYPNLSHTHIVSRDSFILKQSKSVLSIIYALRYIESKDPVAGYYVALAAKQPDIESRLDNIDKSLPLYETVQKVVELLLCDQTITDTAYINCLLDNVRTYVFENGSNLQAFLQYWDDFLCNKAIPSAQTDAIQIMTVHSSKGLESKTLFIPFCSWPLTDDQGVMWCVRAKDQENRNDPNDREKYIPIEIKKAAENTVYEESYDTENIEQKVDNLNLLYVALTRAADNLYIYVNEKVTAKGLDTNNVGYLLIDKEDIGNEVLKTFESNKNTPETMDFVECEKGSITIPKAKKISQSTFGFETATTIDATLHSDSGQVRFRQSQEGKMHSYSGQQVETTTRQELGTICHDLLSHIKTQADVQSVIESAYAKGVFTNDQQRDEAIALISKIWKDPRLLQWFNGSWTLLCEQAILIDGKECRPDRVMIQGNKAIVLDYKFGAENSAYNEQVKEYMHTMQELGYTDVEGYLWYATKETTEALKEVKQ